MLCWTDADKLLEFNGLFWLKKLKERLPKKSTKPTTTKETKTYTDINQ